MADVATPDSKPVHGAPYPAKTKTATGTVNGVPTEAEVSYFRDKILVLVSQSGRLAQWIQVPLSAPSAASVDAALSLGVRSGSNPATGLLPSTHLTPRTLFGAGGEARETFGQLVAAQIGSLVALRDPSETRTLVVGLGLAGPSGSRGSATNDAQAQAVYFDVVDLVQKAL
ncbi:proteasome assembly chaperone 3 [Sporothrix schenckii 1099-18]|uniref:Proteasome assembly chaperone 3 n=2 Tax=Sporothrix schenckii TaxID=29908 RepID=U7PKZ8_SPOS1|nr:proteasome assembly chaperone 3 [Sporothrix schenckii 1099-18]ERS95596.1 hypothetical protein HMPREF1624_08112 [Sporothrix schenckii ATCC 58251]KJR86613.1 proteasome assembly chaperone 3 [Sporothrix schenckii 1099-18]